MARKQSPPDGYVFIPFGGSGDDVGIVEITGTWKDSDGKRRPIPTITVPDVVVPFPLPGAGMLDYAEGRTYDVRDVDGNAIAYSGVEALAASKVKHDYETVRGAYRTEAVKILKAGGDPVKAIDVDAVRGEFRTVYRPGRQVATKLDRSSLAGKSAEEIMAELEARGMLK